MESSYYEAFEEYMDELNEQLSAHSDEKYPVRYYPKSKQVKLKHVIEHMTGEMVEPFISQLKKNHVPNGLEMIEKKDGDLSVSYHHAMLIICLSQSHVAEDSIKTISEKAHKKTIDTCVSKFISVDGYTGFIGGSRVFIFPVNKNTRELDCWMSLKSVKSMLGYKQEVKEITRIHFKGNNSEFVESYGDLIKNNIIYLPECENMFLKSFDENLMNGAIMPKMQDATKMVNLAGLIYLTISGNIPKAREYSRGIVNEMIPQLTTNYYKQSCYVRPNDMKVAEINTKNPSGLYIIKSPLFNYKYGQTTFGSQRMRQHSGTYMAGYKAIVDDYKKGKKYDYTDADIEIAKKIINGEMQPFKILLFIEFDNPSILERLFRDYIRVNGLGVQEKINGVNKDEFFRPSTDKTIDQIINDAIHLAETKPSKSSKLINELEKKVKSLEDFVDSITESEKNYIEQIKVKDEQLKAKDKQLKARDEQLKAKDEQLKARDEQFNEMKLKLEASNALFTNFQSEMIKIFMFNQGSPMIQPLIASQTYVIQQPYVIPQPAIQQPTTPQPRVAKKGLPLFDRNKIDTIVELFKDTKTRKNEKKHVPVTEMYNEFCEWLKSNYEFGKNEKQISQMSFSKIFCKYYEAKTCSRKKDGLTLISRSYSHCELLDV